MNSGSGLSEPSAVQIKADVEHAFAEDIGQGDATADLLSDGVRANARLTCREDAILAGRPWFDACFRQLDSDISIQWNAVDGQRVSAGSVICHLSGNARALVTAERTALNFLQLLSGTATTTAAYLDAVAGTAARVMDTRKTVPGLRMAQKYAVRCGGGHNQRMGLYDAILIKENHIIAAGGIDQAVHIARQHHPELPVEVEVENLDELERALATDVDRIMLDNFELALLREAVARNAGKIELEASGNVDLGSIGDIARTGVDCISVGALTKHVRAVDLSLRLQLT